LNVADLKAHYRHHNVEGFWICGLAVDECVALVGLREYAPVSMCEW
jgi:hypothetical protein